MKTLEKKKKNAECSETENMYFDEQRICLVLFPVIIFFKESFLMLPMGVYRVLIQI